MELFKSVRSSIGRYFYKKKLSNLRRRRGMSSLASAKNIGVLFSLKDEKYYNSIVNIVKNLQNERKMVKALGHVDEKLVPAYCIPMLSFDFFTKKDINWYNKPSNAFVDDFIDFEFDVLIDLSIDDNIYLQYISGLSKAKFKVGRGDVGKDCYDLMMAMKNNVSLGEYVNEINHYLNVLNEN